MNFMINLYSLIYISILFVLPLHAQQDSSRRGNTIFEQSRSRFDSLWNKSLDDYQSYYQSKLEAFESYKTEVERKWGNYVGSTKKDWVEYNQNKTSRSKVDFEDGEASVEVLMEPEEAQNNDLVKQQLEKAIEDLVTSKGTSKEYDSPQEPISPLSEEPILTGQVQNKSGEIVTTSNSEQFANELVETSTIQTEEVVGKDSHKRVKAFVSFSLVPNHIRIRAEKYASMVEKYANHYKLPRSLVFAVIHTESFFNPKAISSAPAYGLMQLVPHSGGREAYKFVYKKDLIVTPNYLFNPEKNIELGTAYLYLLMKRHFQSVQDPQSRTYCAIAGYNTGPGNVSRAFTNSRNVNNAIRKINTMPNSQVYNHMRYNLPYSETRHYIELVTQRIKQYEIWMKRSE